MNRFEQRLRKLESVFVVPTVPSQPRDEEYELICRHDPEAMALCKEAEAIVQDAVKDLPDRETLRADINSLYAAMDMPSLERLRLCIEALHARVDLLRKKPKPARPVEKAQASRR